MCKSEIVSLIILSIIVIIFIICSLWAVKTAYAFVDNPPPVETPDIYNWMEQVQQDTNFPNLPVVTTNPNGNRGGQVGDMVWYYTSTGFYLMVCASEPTTWRGTKVLTVIE